MEVKCIGDYDLISPIVLEGSCRTYYGEHRFLRKEVIIKMIDSPNASSAYDLMAYFEKIDHPHLVKPLIVEKDQDTILLIYDRHQDSKQNIHNLYDFLHQHEHLSEEMCVSILTQVASALDYLSKQTKTYANLKLTNCLVTDVNKNGIKIGLVDYLPIKEKKLEEVPLAIFEKTFESWHNRSIESKEDLIGKHQLNLAFLAPEMFCNPKDHASLNAYAFGVMAFYLTTKMVPHPLLPSVSQLKNLNHSFDVLIQACLHFQPHERPQSLINALNLLSKKKEEVIKPEIKVSEIVLEIQKSPAIKTLDSPSNVELKPVLKAQELIRPTFDPDPAQIFHADHVIAPYRPKEKEQIDIMPIQTDMVVIQQGEYARGSNEGARDERPSHKVFLSSFAMDIHPVTNEQFVRFLEVMGGEKDNHNNDLIRLRESRIKRSAGKLIIESGYAKHPVVGVSWYGATGYAKWVGKRLPTEAEWEVASRSLKPDMVYPTGLNIERTHANYFSADTTPVMSYPPIDIGLYDIAGNVYEWCHDWYDYNFYESSLQEPTNPKGPNQGVYRVLRGGCWKSLKDDLRCSHRHRNNPGTVNKTYGFRCAADVEAVS